MEMFALGAPVYRQRFRQDRSAVPGDRFFRTLRAAGAYAEELRGPLAGAIQYDESVFGGSLNRKRG